MPERNFRISMVHYDRTDGNYTWVPAGYMGPDQEHKRSMFVTGRWRLRGKSTELSVGPFYCS